MPPHHSTPRCVDGGERWFNLTSPARLTLLLMAICLLTISTVFAEDPVLRVTAGGLPLTAGQPRFLQTGETTVLQVHVDPNYGSGSPASFVLACLHRLDDSKDVFTTRHECPEGAGQETWAFELEQDVAGQPGVYELQVTVQTDRPAVWSRFRDVKPIAEHRSVWIVLPEPDDPTHTESWSNSVELDRLSASQPMQKINRWATKSGTSLLTSRTEPNEGKWTPLAHLDSTSQKNESVWKLKPGQTTRLRLQHRRDFRPLSPHPHYELYRVLLRTADRRRDVMRVSTHPPMGTNNGVILDQPASSLWSKQDSHTAETHPWQMHALWVHPVNGVVELWLENLGDQDVLLESATLEGVVLLPNEGETQVSLGGPAETPMLWYHLQDSAWLARRTDIATDSPHSQVSAADHFHHLFISVRRLSTLLKLAGVRGVVLTRPDRKLSRLFTAFGLKVTDQLPEATMFHPERSRWGTVVVPNQQSRERWNHLLGQSPPSDVVLEFGTDAFPGHRNWIAELRRHGKRSAFRIKPIASDDPDNATALVNLMQKGDVHLLELTNVAPWPNTIRIDHDQPTRWVPHANPDFENSATEVTVWRAVQTDSPDRVFEVDLDPGQSTVFELHRSEQPLPSSTSSGPNSFPGHLGWTSVPRGGAERLKDIRWQVTQTVERIGLLSEMPLAAKPTSSARLSNGGFEAETDQGLKGWVHAQVPVDAVTVDTAEAFEGRRSIRVRNPSGSANRTWIVSESIAAPISGRLAVSASVRGGVSKEDSAPLKLRVAVEAVGEHPFRQFREIEVPASGKWQPRQVLIECPELTAELGQVRLAIDLLSTGTVWLDDVRLADWFPTQRERQELQSQAYLAIEGLRKGNLTSASELLQNRWSRNLLAEQATASTPKPSGHSPFSMNPDRAGKQDREQQIETTTREKPPGIARQIRDWLPKPIRF